ncbi:MAG: DUF1801 domain-containing protein [Ancrocorticia sp.]
MAKSHPHIDSPTAEQLRNLAEGRPQKIVDAYLALHEIVIETLPELTYSVDEVDGSVGYGPHQYGYNGWGIAALTPYGKWVSLTLLQGARLADPNGLLQGNSTMRHVKLSGPQEVESNRAAVVELLRAAVRVNE